jgi:hypothetical protein
MPTPAVKIFLTYEVFISAIEEWLNSHPEIIWEKCGFFSAFMQESMVNITIENDEEFLIKFRDLWAETLLP